MTITVGYLRYLYVPSCEEQPKFKIFPLSEYYSENSIDGDSGSMINVCMIERTNGGILNKLNFYLVKAP